jgi:hypothetical protein
MARTVTLRKAPLKVADEVWLVTASLQQAYPEEDAFPPVRILSEAKSLNLTGKIRRGVGTHVHSLCVANRPPKPARHRMLFELPSGDLRLYRPGDPAHPERTGKITPDRNQLPAQYPLY